MNEELWKPIKGYENLYEASSFGNVRSIYRYKKILKPYTDKDGYLRVKLSKDKKKRCLGVHKCVALAFLDNPKHYEMINHKDENPKNNCVDNLEWCNAKYNANFGNHNYKISISNGKPVAQILNGEVINIFNSLSEAERETKIFASNIYRVCVGQRKHSGGYGWKYIEKEQQ